MPLVTQPIKNLKGGVSQQPDILRFQDQGNAQVNGFPAEVHGLLKRPPSKHITRLTETQGTKRPLLHLINRDRVERYYVFFEPNTGMLFVIDLQGNIIPVSYPNGNSYLVSADPRQDIRAVTIADYTFIINHTKQVLASATPAHVGYRTQGNFLISVKGGQYGRTYRVIIDGGEVGKWSTPDGSTAAHAAQIDTQFITDNLAADLTARLGPIGWTISKGPNWIKGTGPAGFNITTLATEDGFNGGLMAGVVFDAQRFSMLPAQAPDGYIVHVLGDPGSDSSDYYVRFDKAAGTWRETTRPGQLTGFNSATMPHVLVREAGGTFTFREATWTPRNSGDDISNPVPSFMGGYISDVFFFRNRLGLLSGENIIMSQSGEFFSFYPKSVVASPDTDPIDVAVSSPRVASLNHATTFNEELLLWSDATQFILRSDGVLSPRSIRVDPATEFENAIDARPVAAGRSVYFAAPRAEFTSIRRYYAVQDGAGSKNAEDITGHVPSYIPNGVFSMSSSTSENVVAVLTGGAENRIYLYKYLYLQEQLVQQAWGYWEFSEGSRILAAEFVGSTMFLMRDSPDGLFMESVEFTQNTKDLPQEPYRCYVDRKTTVVPMSYDEATNTTAIALGPLYGAIPASGDYWLIRQDGWATLKEKPVDGWASVAGVVRVDGNQTGKTYIVGAAYEFMYEFSKFYIKIEDQKGTRSEDVGRLQLRHGWINYENSGPFRVTVGDFTYDMTGKRTGLAITGALSLDTGKFQYAIMGDASQVRPKVTSNAPTPLALIGAGWNGNYFRREQGV